MVISQRRLQPTGSTKMLARSWVLLRPICVAAVVVCCLQLNFDVSLGQDDLSIRVARPDLGVAPAPWSDKLDTSSDEQAADSLSEVSSDADLEAMELDDRQTVDSNETIELSVKPGFKPLLPADRPAWVGAEPDYSGEIHRLYVGSVAVSRRSEADEALELPLVAALNGYIDEIVLNTKDAGHALGIDENYIRRNLVNNSEGCLLELNGGTEPLFQKWVTLEVTPEQRAQFKQWHLEEVQRQRIAPLGLGLASVLGLIALSHIVLRRKHGLSTSQPFADDGLVANEPAVVSSRRGSSSFAIAVLLLGAVAVAAFLLVGFGLASYRAVSHDRVRERAHSRDVEATKTPSIPRPPRVVEPPPVVTPTAVSPAEVISIDRDWPTVQESEFEQEFIIESEQEVIQRIKRDR